MSRRLRMPFARSAVGMAPAGRKRCPIEVAAIRRPVDVAGSGQGRHACVQAERRSEPRKFPRRHNIKVIRRGASELGRSMTACSPPAVYGGMPSGSQTAWRRTSPFAVPSRRSILLMRRSSSTGLVS